MITLIPVGVGDTAFPFKAAPFVDCRTVMVVKQIFGTMTSDFWLRVTPKQFIYVSEKEYSAKRSHISYLLSLGATLILLN